MENNKNKKSVKFQGDMLNFCGFIQVFVFTRNHHLNLVKSRSMETACIPSEHGQMGPLWAESGYSAKIGPNMGPILNFSLCGTIIGPLLVILFSTHK